MAALSLLEIHSVKSETCMISSLYGCSLHVMLKVEPSLAVMWLKVFAVLVIPALLLMVYYSSFLEANKRVVIQTGLGFIVKSI